VTSSGVILVPRRKQRYGLFMGQMGRGGIEPPTDGFSVPRKPRFSPQESRYARIQIHGNTLRNKGRLCRTQVVHRAVASTEELASDARRGPCLRPIARLGPGALATTFRPVSVGTPLTCTTAARGPLFPSHRAWRSWGWISLLVRRRRTAVPQAHRGLATIQLGIAS
jgi:hypothetical protein